MALRASFYVYELPLVYEPRANLVRARSSVCVLDLEQNIRLRCIDLRNLNKTIEANLVDSCRLISARHQ